MNKPKVGELWKCTSIEGNLQIFLLTKIDGISLVCNGVKVYSEVSSISVGACYNDLYAQTNDDWSLCSEEEFLRLTRTIPLFYDILRSLLKEKNV